MRYTEYHAGKAVIRDKALIPGAMEKLAKIEDMDYIPEVCCDEYCKYPGRCRSQDETDQICDRCKLAELFDLLVDKENYDLGGVKRNERNRVKAVPVLWWESCNSHW